MNLIYLGYASNESLYASLKGSRHLAAEIIGANNICITCGSLNKPPCATQIGGRCAFSAMTQTSKLKYPIRMQLEREETCEGWLVFVNPVGYPKKSTIKGLNVTLKLTSID